MISPSLHELRTIGLAFLLAALLTPVVRAGARKLKFVAQPKSDRWHKRPTAMLGGVALFLSVAIMAIAVGPRTWQAAAVLAGSAFLFLIGLFDDLYHAKPYQKLIGQVMAAAIVICSGLILPWTGSQPLNMVITIFWLVGITNAINLLDNMDGLAAGVSAIAAVFLAVNCGLSGQPNEALLLYSFAAVLIGFLLYNSHPATIFMGDCGSMFIGFFLASSTLASLADFRSRSLLPVLAVPVLTLMIPIFDTTLVTVMRKLAGRRATQGGRDHTSHRLVALGLSERRAVWLLYLLATLSGILALGMRGMSLDLSLAAIAGVTVVLSMLGVHLARVTVYDEAEVQAARTKPLVAFLVNLSYKRRIFEVLLDVVLIGLAYYIACTLLHGPASSHAAWRAFPQVVPLLVFIKLAAFLVAGVYRGLWKYVSIDNLIVAAKAVLLGSLAGAAVTILLIDNSGWSLELAVIDAMLLLLLVCGSRIAFRVLRQMIPAPKEPEQRRVLIYGAGDAGELLLRELLNNRSLHCGPVGFADDDPLKRGKVIHGLKVFGGNGSFLSIVQQQRVDEVIISSSKFSEQRINEILRDCQQFSIIVKRMRIEVEQLTPS